MFEKLEEYPLPTKQKEVEETVDTFNEVVEYQYEDDDGYPSPSTFIERHKIIISKTDEWEIFRVAYPGPGGCQGPFLWNKAIGEGVKLPSSEFEPLTEVFKEANL